MSVEKLAMIEGHLGDWSTSDLIELERILQRLLEERLAEREKILARRERMQGAAQ